MDEIRQLFGRLILSENVEPEIIEFNNRKIRNYRIIYEDRSIATVKELIANTTEKIKRDEWKKYDDFYTNIIAHLIAYYIIKKMRNKDPEYSKELEDYHDALTEAIYIKILDGNPDKYTYYGKIWTEKQMEEAFISYIKPKLKPIFGI
jgi:hypothetical protein